MNKAYNMDSVNIVLGEEIVDVDLFLAGDDVTIDGWQFQDEGIRALFDHLDATGGLTDKGLNDLWEKVERSWQGVTE